MILSAEYAHGATRLHQSQMHHSQTMTMLHSPHNHNHSVYAPYLVETPPWHHSAKQESEEISMNNDSGVSPSHYASDGSGGAGGRDASPRSEDSGHGAEQAAAAPNAASAAPATAASATLGVLARPIAGSPPGAIRLSPEAPQQRLSPQYTRHTPPPSLPQRESPLQHSIFGLMPQQSPPRHEDNSRSPASSSGEPYEDPLRGLQMALQRRGMMGPLPTTPEAPVSGEKPLQCPLCQYSTTIRSAFNNHLVTEHSEQANCHICDHTAENPIRLREHLRSVHGQEGGLAEEEGGWMESDDGVATPRVNSQGKVKTYRCKQCEFSTVTKLDFWEHTRGHIKPERLLTCPKCPFVTEYKHHLEYHLRNHFGSKPFKCDKCAYSCVNKSMLNSHLKSHSSVYQFRCKTCGYATKYCHSLKLHLRKNQHEPDNVLNPDGTPNPLPIIDVYGTRRGPKRPKKPEESPQQSLLPSLHPMFSNPYNFLTSQAMTYPYNPLMNFQPNHHLLFPNPSGMPMEEPPTTEPETDLFSATVSTIRQSAINNNQEGVKEYLTKVITTQREIVARTEANQEEESRRAYGAPLDLSRPEPSGSPLEISERSVEAPGTPSDQSSTTKNRRKGKAIKRIAQSHQQSSDEEFDAPSPKRMELDLSPVPTEQLEVPKPVPEAKSPSSPKVSFNDNGDFHSGLSEERKQRWRNVKEIYDCSYCDLLFGDVVMYTVHMGYHKNKSPFTCNMCGKKTNDRLSFSMHLSQAPHFNTDSKSDQETD